mgnify:CR=1 FL=1
MCSSDLAVHADAVRVVELAVAAAGKHCLLEKPMASTSRQCDEMVAAFRQAGKVLAINFEYRVSPLLRSIRDDVRTGRIGKLLSIRLVYNWDNHWHRPDFHARRAAFLNEGFGCMDCGVHYLDLGRWIGGGDFVRLAAEGTWAEPQFRGWGGSSHPDVAVSPQGFSTEEQYLEAPRGYVPGRTTRGFLPGPIPPGTWAAELGVAFVGPADDAQADFRVEIELLPSTRDLDMEDLCTLLEEQGSSPLYPVLKRPDEKYVTETAYDNAKFVEDILRDSVLALRHLPGIRRFKVECESVESIHNHNAFAATEEWLSPL